MSAPWMPLYVADYLADTGHLNAAEHGAYMLLIMHYWRTGALPADEGQLRRIGRMSTAEWKRSRDTLAAFFNDDWTHDRIEHELSKSAQKSEARADAGSRGGHAKAARAKTLKTKKARVANATILPEQNDALALASSSLSDSVSLRSTESPPSAPSEPKAPKGASGHRGTHLSDDWRPKDRHYAKAAELGQGRVFVDDLADQMREWAGANRNRPIARKADWDLTFDGFLRRETASHRNGARAGPSLSVIAAAQGPLADLEPGTVTVIPPREEPRDNFIRAGGKYFRPEQGAASAAAGIAAVLNRQRGTP